MLPDRTVCWPALLALAGWLVPSISLAEPMQYPLAVAAVDADTLYIVDRNLPGIWKLDQGKLVKYFQGAKQLRKPLNAPRSAAVDGQGRLLVGDSATREVYRFNEAGEPEPLTGGGIGTPMDIAVMDNGDLLVSDLELERIWKVPAAGGEPEPFADVRAPRGIALDGQGRLWVVSRGEDELLRVSPDGQVESVIRGRVFGFAHDVAIDPEGSAYVSDNYSAAIWKISDNGKPENWVSGPPLQAPVGIIWREDHLLVADPRAQRIFRIGRREEVVPVEFSTESEAPAGEVGPESAEE